MLATLQFRQVFVELGQSNETAFKLLSLVLTSPRGLMLLVTWTLEQAETVELKKLAMNLWIRLLRFLRS